MFALDLTPQWVWAVVCAVLGLVAKTGGDTVVSSSVVQKCGGIDADSVRMYLGEDFRLQQTDYG